MPELEVRDGARGKHERAQRAVALDERLRLAVLHATVRRNALLPVDAEDADGPVAREDLVVARVVARAHGDLGNAERLEPMDDRAAVRVLRHRVARDLAVGVRGGSM